MSRQTGIGRVWLLTAVLVLGMSCPVWAMPIFTPPWVSHPDDPMWAGGSTTQQAWEFWGNPLGHTAPAHWDNPWGPPSGSPYTPINSTPQFISNGPGLTGVNTWHVDADGGGFSLFIPNDTIA